MQELIEGRDYRLVDEGMAGISDYLDRTGRNLVHKLIGIADNALSGRKGHAATTALNLAGLTSDARAFSETFSRHSDAINEYFEYVDLAKLGKMLAVDKTLTKELGPSLVVKGIYLASGVAIGLLLTTLLNPKN